MNYNQGMNHNNDNRMDIDDDDNTMNFKEMMMQQKQKRIFDAIQCQGCHTDFDPYEDVQKIYYLSDCAHLFCKKCLSK